LGWYACVHITRTFLVFALLLLLLLLLQLHI
jgi:hypothetical protein